ncbi:MAG: two-component system response regulator [Acidobacteria bacterium]|nr:MAG: two-component system response regulator [Acidobacteriota bacterium]PYQ25811.1 MAG: two-component system response regulator [Acidobacteriota bacterium]
MRRKSILLVEDNPDDEALTLRALRSHDVAGEVVVVRDGAEALAFFYEATRAGDVERLPGLVLLDLKLPKVDGLQVLKILREDEHTRRIPVVVLSSSSEERDIVQSYDLGANSYVRKPVDFSVFSETVRQLGIYWLSLNEPSPR